MLIGTVKEAAKIRLDIQHIEVVSAGLIEPYRGRVATGVQRGIGDVVRQHAVKAPVPVAQIPVIGVRLRGTVSLAVGALQHEQVFGVRHIQRAQYKRIHYTKDYGVCANSQCQR